MKRKKRSFPGCSRAVPLCLSGVSSWSPQEFFCLRIKTTSKHPRPPECVAPAFRGLSPSVMIPGCRLHANIPKGECTPTCRPRSVTACVKCPRFLVWFVSKWEPVFVMGDFHARYSSQLSTRRLVTVQMNGTDCLYNATKLKAGNIYIYFANGNTFGDVLSVLSSSWLMS